MYETDLSIIIVNYNVKHFLEQCLLSVQAATQSMSAEVIVVDNNSTDGSVEYLRPKFPEVRFIENKDNPGFAKANNQALRVCKGEYALLLNPDTVIGEDSLRTLCVYMDEHPRVGAMGVKMLDANGCFLPESKRSFPSPWVSFCKLSGLSSLFKQSRLFASYSLPYLSKNKVHEVEVLAGAFLLLRHEAVEKVGLLDESFFMYGEDIDFSYRMLPAGYTNVYYPERILHYKGESTKYGDVRYAKAFYGAMSIFFRKYYPRSGWVMRFPMQLYVGFQSVLTRLGLGKKRKKMTHKRLLVVAREAHFEAVKAACVAQMPELEHVNLWDLDEERVMDVICRRNQMKNFTDIALYYPDVRFEQMLLLMDKMPNKRTTFHIYTQQGGHLLSPGE